MLDDEDELERVWLVDAMVDETDAQVQMVEMPPLREVDDEPHHTIVSDDVELMV